MSLVSVAVVLKRHAGNVPTGVSLARTKRGLSPCSHGPMPAERPDHILYFNRPEEAVLQQHRIETPGLQAGAVSEGDGGAGGSRCMFGWSRILGDSIEFQF